MVVISQYRQSLQDSKHKAQCVYENFPVTCVPYKRLTSAVRPCSHLEEIIEEAAFGGQAVPNGLRQTEVSL